MSDLKKYFENLVEKINGYFIGTDKPASKKEVTLKKWFNLGIIAVLAIISFIVLLLFIASNDKTKNGLDDGNITDNSNIGAKHTKIELGTDATKADVKWQNFLEESIETESAARQQQIELLKQTVAKSQETSKEELNTELEELKSRLSYALNEIDRLSTDNQNILQDIASLGPENNNEKLSAELGITAINTKLVTKPPVSSFNYIPATSYVSDNLLHDIRIYFFPMFFYKSSPQSLVFIKHLMQFLLDLIEKLQIMRSKVQQLLTQLILPHHTHSNRS